MSDYQLINTWSDIDDATTDVMDGIVRSYAVNYGSTDLAPETVYAELITNGKKIQFELVDAVTKNRAILLKAPTSSGNDATFYTVDVDNEQFVIYTLSTNGGTGGNVTMSTIPFDQSSSSTEVFRFNISYSNSSWQMDCNWSDIAAAKTAGQIIIASYSDKEFYSCGDPNDDGIQLVHVRFNSGVPYGEAFTITDQGVITDIGPVALNGSAIWSGSLSLTTAQQAQARTNFGALGSSDIGTVFTLKGSVANVASLPSSGNTVGDVYYVESVSAGYIWLTSTTYPNGYWEELGETVDLSAYQLKPTVVTVTENTPTIALAEDNKIYKCTGTAITSITITARDTNAAFSLIFDTPSGASAPTFTYPTVNMILPDGFAVEAYKHYEINVDSDGFAAVGSWSFD